MDRIEICKACIEVFEQQKKLIAGFDAVAMNKVPSEGSWTAGQVVQHMIIANAGFVQLLRGAVADTSRPIDLIVPRIAADFLDFEIKMESPKSLVPEDRLYEPHVLLDEIMKIQNDVKAIVEELDLTKTCVNFELPVYGFLTRIEAVYFVVCHTKRHNHQLQIISDSLDDSSKGIVIAQGLAEILKVGIGDRVVIYGQGYHGVTAAAQIPIIGIVKFTLPDLNKSFTYLTLNYAQWLFSATERLTSVSIMIDNPNNLERIKSQIKNIFNEDYEVMDWEELSPELVQSIQVDNAQGIIMLGILYVVIAFGIFGTIMMMTAERVKEFGILISVGMKKWKLGLVTLYETLFISFLGVFTGAIISIPILLYFKANPIPLTGEMADAILAWGFEPILPFAVYPGMFFAQIWTVLAIAIVSALYPILFIRKLKPVEALRG